VTLVDANLLIYAVNKRAEQHDAARAWLSEQLTGAQRVGLPWQSLAAFLRISTHQRASTRPLSGRDAWAFVEEWLAAGPAWIPVPGPSHAEIVRDLIARHDVRGNLITDTMLAALAIEHGLTLYSTDGDFARFDELRWVNPLAAA
jgi:toxin-antitoxin system PIN domain toxin